MSLILFLLDHQQCHQEQTIRYSEYLPVNRIRHNGLNALLILMQFRQDAMQLIEAGQHEI